MQREAVGYCERPALVVVQRRGACSAHEAPERGSKNTEAARDGMGAAAARHAGHRCRVRLMQILVVAVFPEVVRSYQSMFAFENVSIFQKLTFIKTHSLYQNVEEKTSRNRVK